LRPIELIAPLRFEDGSADFKGKSDDALDALANTLRQSPQMKIVIASHTAEESDAKASLALSQKRAAAVRQALEKRGIGGERVRATGCGQTRPVAPNNVPWGRKKNDRVEVFVLDPARSTGVQSLEGCAHSEGT
jgi:outer membrane protein OmpA-like peptidoglycan-associated protein